MHSQIGTTKSKANFGAIAQLVEQRTENPCVPGSIPGGTTLRMKQLRKILTAFAVLYRAEMWRKMAACFLKCFLENDNS